MASSQNIAIQLREQHGEEALGRCHFFNSFFYKRLSSAVSHVPRRDQSDPKNIEAAYQTVRRWTKKDEIFRKDYLFIPINEHLHWSLVVVYKPGEYARQEYRRRKRARGCPDSDDDEKAAGDGKGAQADEEHFSTPSADTDTEEDDLPVDEMTKRSRAANTAKQPDEGVEDDDVEDEVEGGDDRDDRDDEDDVEDEVKSEEGELDDSVNLIPNPTLCHPMDEYEGEEAQTESQEDAPADHGAGVALPASSSDEEEDELVPEQPSVAPAAAAGTPGNAVDLCDSEEEEAAMPPGEPCILYFDSLNATPTKYLNLLKTYLHLEYEEKVLKARQQRKKKEAEEKEAAAKADGCDASSAANAAASSSTASVAAGSRKRSQAAAAASDETPSQGSDVQVTGEKRLKSTPALDYRHDVGMRVDGDSGHLFSELRSGYMEVTEQPNGYDCGLYMLKYIERIAEKQPDLSRFRKTPKAKKQHWKEFVKEDRELEIGDRVIRQRRQSMAEEIEERGKKQEQERLKAKAGGGGEGSEMTGS